MDEKANRIFKTFLEAVLAYSQNTQYCSQDSFIMKAVEELMEETGDVDKFRRELAAFYFAVEKKGPVRWDSHPQVRDALLKHMKVDKDDYLIAMGLKQRRTIDDPWEPS